MKVKDLIAELQRIDSEAEVYFGDGAADDPTVEFSPEVFSEPDEVMESEEFSPCTAPIWAEKDALQHVSTVWIR